MANAKIYKPSKTAMQSGKAKSHKWILEYSAANSFFVDSFMGCHGTDDTLHQVRLTFQTLEAAMAYAEKMNLTVQVATPHFSKISPKNYSDKFRYDRV